MRPIKFRAWIFLENKMQYEDLFGAEKFGGRDCEIMQFTGLLDKNGKEIWEGDYVSSPHGRKVVIFERGMFSATIINNGKYCFDSWLGLLNDNCEVLGNIFENPELLN